MKFFAKVFLVSGEYSRLISAAQRKRTVTVKLDFVDPIYRGAPRLTRIAFIGSTNAGKELTTAEFVFTKCLYSLQLISNQFAIIFVCDQTNGS